MPVCRGILHYNGKNQISYLNVRSDGRTSEGSDKLDQCPVYQTTNTCIGVLICMDVDCVQFARHVITKVRSSTASWKGVCVPADMDSSWFNSIGPLFEGVHVILCNHTRTYQGAGRCKSFISNTALSPVQKQKDEEPIHYTFTIS